MISLHQISYIHPNRDLLFENINLTVNAHEKVALIGNNGVGKSTLLRLITGSLLPAEGTVQVHTAPYYVPQITGQLNEFTVAQALGIEQKLTAFHAILKGDASEHNFNLLQDDWTLEDRYKEAFDYWKIPEVLLTKKMDDLSGGQKAKVMLAGIQVHQSELILLDEPSNHLDLESKNLLYEWIVSSKNTIVAVSHDRTLLDLLEDTLEMTPGGIKRYGGNYTFYEAQKNIERNAMQQDIHHQEKAMRAAKEKEREALERQNRLNNRGHKKQEKAGVARIMMNTLRNKAEKSTAKIKNVHQDKIEGFRANLQELRNAQAAFDEIKIDLENGSLPFGKNIIKAEDINYSYGVRNLWEENVQLQIVSGDRIALTGKNGSGKTTLVKLLLGQLTPSTGRIVRQHFTYSYLDQDYSIVDSTLTVYEQAQRYNSAALAEHEIKIRLNRFLFGKEDWDKACGLLSGGEKMRLIICCLTIQQQAPELIILDEPTNNLDIQNIRVLTRAIRQYKGTVLVISHDEVFVKDIGIGRSIGL
ncbi:ABC-F family ATP-binding cassette domain-containing protein [Sphingobacterium thalpophilum]|uniref:ABC-F family ATP-binding cassette domain-containing protein n=1 Tax=Sphingobacterium thalpophilum TaxID=259 RepID=UPI0024A6BC43|nr:ABC-F family ATP-binding cassette domain-containing protein [Sphingobacterium thalpophilum]